MGVRLDRLPETVRRPAYDRSALGIGMAHVGVGAFHRCHQAEFTDDGLEARFGRWGVVGINIRAPRIGPTLGRQDGLYTRLLRDGERVDARVIGCLRSVVDAQESAEPALRVLAAPEIAVITLTVTEKGYGHRPASGRLDPERPDIVHDLAHPETPRSLPGLLVQALERRMGAHGRPVTILSCDNIPSNGAILGGVVREMAERRGPQLLSWIEANAAFPSTMVDRIVPATSPADLDLVEERFGYRDEAVVTGEPFRQWVIEDRFAGPAPPWDLAGAAFVADVAPFELLKMRVLNAAQSAFAGLGLLAGHKHTSDDVADPVLAAFIRRMLVEESLPTLPPVPGVSARAYVDRSFERLANRAIRHTNRQIATDGSQKIVQRFLNPMRERLARGEGVERLAVAVAAWMACLAGGSERLGRRWAIEDPYAQRIARIADRVGRDGAALAAGIMAVDAVFDRALAESEPVRSTIARHLDGLLSEAPIAYVKGLLDTTRQMGRTT